MDFEEGEVDDISDTESDIVSPASEMQIQEWRNRSGPVMLKRNRDKHVYGKRRHSRLRGTGLRDGLRNLPNLSAYENRPTDSHVVCNSDEDFQIVCRERDRNFADNRRKKKRKKEKFIKPMQTIKCRFFMDGRCQKGGDCPYEHNFHPPKKQELCKFYAVGVCSKGKSCLFLHNEFPCKFFHLHGKCNQGDNCKFSHNQLNKQSRLLLDRITIPKDGVDSFGDKSRDVGRSLLGPGDCSGLNEHGDVDYRCGQIHNRNTVNYAGQSPPQLLFTPIFNQRPFPNDPEMPETGSHPGFRSAHNPPPTPQFIPGHFGGQQFMPNRLEAPPFRHMSPAQRLRPDLPMNPHPPHLGLLPPRPSMFGEFTNSPGGPRFRPPQYRPPIRNTLPTEVNGIETGYPTSEEIVRSELDKIAALLASSRPPCSSTNASVDPRTQSPEQQSNQQPVPSPSEDTPTIPSTPKTTQGRSSVSVSSPDGGSSESQQLQQPLNKSNGIAWRLIQLDMNVKIPYPLMQLNVENLPHRFDDPRLRGHLTAFRMQSTQANAVASLPEVSEMKEETLEVTSDAKANPTNTSSLPNDAPVDCPTTPPQGSSQVQRRPVKLQLNEMANVFSVSQQPTRFQSRQGDRSYLDDPRFRRRRIITSGVVGLPVVTGDEDQQPSDTPQSGASVVGLQGDMKHTSA